MAQIGINGLAAFSLSRIWAERAQFSEPDTRVLSEGEPKAKAQRPQATKGSEEFTCKESQIIFLGGGK